MVLECVKCGQRKPPDGYELCYPCYKRAYKPPKGVCSECGRMAQRATKELCPACYYRTRRYVKLVECASCRETKQHAAHGLCYKCYLRWGENYTQRKREFQNMRCGTCDRLLRLVRSRVDMRTKFCDGFCRDHSPERNAKSNIKRMHEATAAELQRRKDEALTHTESAAV